MAFNNLGTLSSINPGATQFWTYFRNNHADFGTQLATPDIKTPGATLVAFDEGKRVETNGQVTYLVSVRNVGNTIAIYNLQGGGMS